MLSNLVDGRVVLGAVVAKIGGSWGPEVTEPTLQGVAPKTVELHVHRLCLEWNNCLFGDTAGCGVVALDGGPRLRPF